MSDFRRFFPLGVAAAILILFEIIQFKPQAVILVGVVALALIFGVVKIFFKVPEDILGRPRFLEYLALVATPLLLIWSALAFLLFIERTGGRQIVAILTTALTAFFFESMLMRKKEPLAFKSYSLENLGSYIATLTIFFGVSALLGVRLLLGVNVGLVAVILIVLVAALTQAVFWLGELYTPVAGFSVWTITFLGLEFFLVLNVLPLHFMVSGAVLTVSWYVAVMLTRAQLLNLLTKRVLYRHLGFGGALLAILLLTAEWL